MEEKNTNFHLVAVSSQAHFKIHLSWYLVSKKDQVLNLILITIINNMYLKILVMLMMPTRDFKLLSMNNCDN